MTKIAIAPNASGTGTFTIAAPNSNVDRTFSLPDATGEVLTDQSNIEAQVKTAANASGSAPIYACRAWVDFVADTTTPSINASGNVSSVTRNGTGEYTVNFTTATSDANYASIATAQEASSGFPRVATIFTKTASSVRLSTRIVSTGDVINVSAVSIAIFR